jgi:hypothetical protein
MWWRYILRFGQSGTPADQYPSSTRITMDGKVRITVNNAIRVTQ